MVWPSWNWGSLIWKHLCSRLADSDYSGRWLDSDQRTPVVKGKGFTY